MRLTLRHKPKTLSKKKYHSSKYRPKQYTLKAKTRPTQVSLRRKNKQTTMNTLFLIHGVLTERRSTIPYNIELITFTQTGINLSVSTAVEIIKILQRNSHKLNKIQFGINKYRLSHADGITISSIHTHHYRQFDSYPDLDLSFENTFGELYSLGFYDTPAMSLYMYPMISSTGTANSTTTLFALDNNIQINKVFLLSTLLNWISQKAPPNTNVRVFLLCCQGFDINQPPPIQDMNLNVEGIDFSEEVNGL